MSVPTVFSPTVVVVPSSGDVIQAPCWLPAGVLTTFRPVPTTLPPFALAPPVFRFRHLAALAGRAPIGGAREVALACFVVARLAAERVGAEDDDPPQRTARSVAAKAWLGTLALPNPVRGAAARCAELGADGERAALTRELRGLVLAASGYLDGQSRAELDVLARSLELSAEANI